MTQMIEVKTAELIGPVLDWAVDAIESGKPLEIRHHKNGSGEWIFVADGVPYPSGPRKFSTDWSQGGPLIEEHRISLSTSASHDGWHAVNHTGCYALPRPRVYADARHPLIAAMRCLVAAKLGEVVMVPAELVTATQ